VMGHDVRAALLAAVMRTLVEERRSTDPGQMLAEMNGALVGILENTEAPLFATAFYLVVDMALSEMRYANAGHPAALHIHRGDVGINPMNGSGKPGPALGLFEGGSYRTSTCRVAPNDLVMLFTDGLFEIEAPSAELFTYERLVDAVGRRAGLPSPALFAGLFAEIDEFNGHREFADDVCVVGMEIRALPGPALN
jgi:serine phosphatase RsbU (regulator of sigma subunit)